MNRFLPSPLRTGMLAPGLWVLRDGFVNAYVLRGPAGLVCVDAGWRPAGILRAMQSLGLEAREVAAVLLTHRHWDHARGADAFPKATLIPEDDLPRTEPSQLCIAGLEIGLIPCPGHTGDSVAYLTGGWLFTGDSVWLDQGRVEPCPEAFNQDTPRLRSSLRGLAALPGLAAICTAHTGVTWDPGQAFEAWQDGK